MSNVATLPIEADRYGACVRQIYVRGLDLTGVSMRAQVRLIGDTPGVPLVDLQTVTNGNAEGLRLVGVDTGEGLPVSHIEMVINETTMEAMPYAGELGASTSFAWDWQLVLAGRKQRIAKGDFVITGDGVTGADNAPANRPAAWSRSFSPTAGMRSGATLTFGDEVMSVTIDGADLVAAEVGRAVSAQDRAEAAQKRADLSAGAAQGVARYFTTRAAGEAASAVDQPFSTDDGAGNVIYYRRTAGGSVEIGRAVTPVALAAPDGAGKVGLRHFVAGAVARTALSKARDWLHAADFGVIANDGVTDETAQMKFAISAAILLRKELRISGNIVVSDSLLAGNAQVDNLRICGDGMSSTQFINKCIGKSLFNIGWTVWAELRDFAIMGNNLTGSQGNGHAIALVDPLYGVDPYFPQLTKIIRVQIRGHRGLDKTYRGDTMPACAVYGANSLSTNIEGCYAYGNSIFAYMVGCFQPRIRNCVCDHQIIAGIVNEFCENMEVDGPDMVGGNTDGSGGIVVVGAAGAQNSSLQNAVTLTAGSIVDYNGLGSVYRSGKYKNHKHAAITLSSQNSPLVTHAWFRQDEQGCIGVLSMAGARIENNEFTFSGSNFVGSRICVHMVPSGGYNEIGVIRANKFTFNGNGAFGTLIRIDGSGAFRVSGRIEGNFAGDATGLSASSTLDAFVRVIGGVRALTVCGNFLSAAANMAVSVAYDYSAINAQADQGLSDDNNGSWDNFGAGVISTRRLLPSAGSYTGLQPSAKYNAAGFSVAGVQVVGAQQQAIADLSVAPTAADFNALLAKLRSHGLIAS